MDLSQLLGALNAARPSPVLTSDCLRALIGALANDHKLQNKFVARVHRTYTAGRDLADDETGETVPHRAKMPTPEEIMKNMSPEQLKDLQSKLNK